MSPASEKELSELHKKVANVLLKKLESADKAKALLLEFYDELPEEIIGFMEDQCDASPAFLTVVTKFLKDNNITAVVEDSKELSELDKRLAEKRQRRVVGNVIPMNDDEE